MRDVAPLRVPERIGIAGDWHGNQQWARYMIDHVAVEEDIDTILHCGDFGLWPGADGERYLDVLNQDLLDVDTILLWVDGNHEDHARLAEWPLVDGLHQIRSRIWHIPRGFRWTWDGIRFMGLGGAVSVDQNMRTPGVSWWPNETISLRDAYRAVRGPGVDVMITHDCPTGVAIPALTKTTTNWPEDVIRASEGNRYLLRQVVEEVRPKALYHGHYHNQYDAILDMDGFQVAIHGLDRDESSPPGNMLIGDLADVIPKETSDDGDH